MERAWGSCWKLLVLDLYLDFDISYLGKLLLDLRITLYAKFLKELLHGSNTYKKKKIKKKIQGLKLEWFLVSINILNVAISFVWICILNDGFWKCLSK